MFPKKGPAVYEKGQAEKAGTVLHGHPQKKRDWRAPFVSLKNRNFRLYIIGSLIATTALQMMQLAQNYLVYQLTGQATAIGYVSAALGASLFFFSLTGGIAADRMSKRNLLISGQIGIGIMALWIGVMVHTGLIEVWHIIVGGIITGIIAGFTMPARQSYVPDLVGDKNLLNAFALNAGVMNVTRIAGPALAGILIAAIGIAPLYYAKFIGYSIFAVFLLMIPVLGKSKVKTSRSMLGDALAGLRYLRRDRTVLELLLIGVFPVILAMPYVNFLPVFQEEVFHVGTAELGLMMSVVGIGAVVGAMFIASISNYRYKGRILITMGITFSVSLVLFSVIAGTGNFPLSLVMLAITGAAGTAYMSLNQALVLVLTPPEMRGRVTGLFMTTFGLQPLGSLPIGMLSDAYGAPVTIGAFGALTLVIFLYVFLFRPRMRQIRDDRSQNNLDRITNVDKPGG
ncbi:MAG TPA: MFS transporter [Dehalococcoidia bacterium]|nr:MFS transporter [Dehalococcoidia bacterium]